MALPERPFLGRGRWPVPAFKEVKNVQEIEMIRQLVAEILDELSTVEALLNEKTVLSHSDSNCA